MIVNLKQIPNTLMVNNIHRGGQPKEAVDWALLNSMGVKDVVKLNSTSEGSDEQARDFGLMMTQLSINRWEQLVAEPTLATIQHAVAILAQGNCFVHCEHGEDRTGLVVGAFRVWKCGWSKVDAYQEMLNNGFHPLLVGLWEFWDTHVNSPT